MSLTRNLCLFSTLLFLVLTNILYANQTNIINQHLNNRLMLQLPPSSFGKIEDWHCVKSTPVLCLAVGSKIIGGNKKPLLLKSTDGGDHWIEQTVENLSSVGSFVNVDCNWDGSLCVAIGNVSEEPNNKSIVVQSNDYANTWVIHDIHVGGYEILEQVKCTGSKTGPFCIIVSTNTDIIANIFYTINNGTEWKLKTGYPNPKLTSTLGKNIRHSSSINGIESTSCTGEKDEAACFIVYYIWDVHEGYLFYYMESTYDGGQHWFRAGD